MKIVITQPNFLPWLGYFHQLEAADVFIVLDSVQYNRKEWQNRNRITRRNGLIEFVTIPTIKAPQKTPIKDIVVSRDFTCDSIVCQVKDAYGELPGVDNACDIITSVLGGFSSSEKLLLRDVNIAFIEQIASLANIETVFARASDFQHQLTFAKGTERLLEICKFFGATTYLSSVGARDYMLAELYRFFDAGIEVKWQNFDHEAYLQNCKLPFISHLSVVDFLVHNDINLLKQYVARCGSFVDEKTAM